MKLSNVLFTLALTFFLIACGNKRPAQPKLPKLNKIEAASETMKNIQMTRWDLESYSYKNLDKAAVPGKRKAYLILRDGRASGYAGCNNFVGKYEEGADHTIRFIDVQVPQKMCKDYALQESNFITLLKTATSYSISESGKNMTVKCLSGELKFTTK